MIEELKDITVFFDEKNKKDNAFLVKFITKPERGKPTEHHWVLSEKDIKTISDCYVKFKEEKVQKE